jgi:AcrR family transcriptional regulator
VKSARRYRQQLRAQQAEETAERVLDAAEQLFAREAFDRVSLATVAEASGVSIPTLQRRFGNKEGLVAAVGARVRARVEGQRSTRGSVKADLDALVRHYELEGPMVWHLLRQEPEVPTFKAALDGGRALHRAWVEQVFSKVLRRLTGPARARRVDALVAATDLYVWKLLRIDLGRSRAAVTRTMRVLADAAARGARE